MGLDKLTQWAAPTTSFRHTGKYGEADATARKGRSRPAVWADSESDFDRAARNGDDLEGNGCCVVAGADGDGVRPIERLNVYRMSGTWRSKDGELRATNHRFNSEAAYARAEIVLLTSSLWREASTLSFMSEGKYDVRPHLLLLFHAQRVSSLAVVVSYLSNYVASHHETAERRLRPLLVRAAALDALQTVWGRRAMASIADRAKELGVRKADYARVRQLMTEVVKNRLREAEVRFVQSSG